MNKNDFYIGWMPNAPPIYFKFVRKYLFALIVLTISLGVVLALSQKQFATGTFEFGKLTELKGIYFSQPIPSLKIVTGKDIWGNPSYITCPLVGYGKHGAAGIIAEIEKEKGTTLNKREVTLKVILLYNDGKTIVQIDKNDNPLVSVGKFMPGEFLPLSKALGTQKVKGEIVDPKCFFGVMKPGEGKVHRDCAIRCILGGIPPVFHVQNEKGESNYYLILGQNGESVNEKITDLVAEPIEIEARLVQQDDWILMYMNDEVKGQRISYYDMLSSGKNCTLTGCGTH